MKLSPRVLAKEMAKRGTRKELALDPRFPKQNAFIEDTGRFISAQCSRRAGKTNGLAIRFFKTLERHPGSQCVYLALTRESAKDIMWGVLQEHNEEYRLGCTFVESKLEMKHPNGSTLKLYGADMKNFIKRLKGRKYPGVAIDEAQDFGIHLQSLIDDVLTPSIADYSDGWLAVTGTPGPVPQGYFFEVTNNGRFGFSPHKWTILDNPYMPDPKTFIEDLKRRREWDDSNPTLMREWRNNWVLDVNSLWVQYKESVNHYDKIPLSPKKLNYILGIDLGFKDADALALVAWSEESNTTYLVEEIITRKQGISELVGQIEVLRHKYEISKMVIDQGGLGLKIAEEIRRRHAIPVIGAEKQRKQETVEFLNDHLRRGVFKAKKDSRFATDSYLVQIDWDKTTPDKIVIKKQPHSDIIDAVIYAFKESPAYTYTAPPKPKAPWGTLEYQDAVQAELEEQAQAYFEAQEDLAKQTNDDDYY